jgi:hypothetical protein
MPMISTLADILADGGRTLDGTDLDARLSECGRCPEGRSGNMQGQAARCGCLMAVKARFAASTCPLGRWPDRPPP